MYSIIQKIYEKNNKILKEGLKDVLNGADVSFLTGAIKDFTDILGKVLDLWGQVCDSESYCIPANVLLYERLIESYC